MDIIDDKVIQAKIFSYWKAAISLNVESTDTIDSLKTRIQHVEGIPPDNQLLFSSFCLSKELEGNCTLADYSFSGEIWMWLCLKHMPIDVEIGHTGRTMSLEVNGSDTIDCVIGKIHAMNDIPLDMQCLYYSGILLRGYNTVRDMCISPGASLRLDFPPMRIFIMINNPHSVISDTLITLDVKSSDTICMLKAKIQDKKGIPQAAQKLTLHGIELGDTFQIELDDNSTLDDYNIQWGADLVLHVKKHIFVTTDTGEIIALAVKCSNTIHDVKCKIQVDHGIPSYRQKLFFAQTKLFDGFTLADYQIRNQCTLRLVLRSPDWMKIFVKSITGKTTTLKVESSDTIGKAKAMVDEKDGTPLLQQRLFIAGMQLDDDRIFADYHIQNGSSLDLMLTPCNRLMPILVNTGNGRTIMTLEVSGSDTVGNVKTKIEKELGGVRPYDMKLDCDELQLENGHTLDDYYIHSASSLRLSVRHRGPLKIYVKFFYTGKTITLEVKSSDPISYTKALIKEIEGIPTNQQILFLDWKQLHDHNSLANCYVQNESTILLLPISRGVIQISINMPGKTITLKVESSETIGSLKANIREAEGIPLGQQLELIYEGNELDECRQIADYGIHWNSDVILVFGSGSRGSMKISVMSETGRTTISHVKVESSWTVGNVKAKILNDEGFDLNGHSLLFDKNLLEDSLTLADYGITNNSILHFCRPPPST